jgi:hypothetical protein
MFINTQSHLKRFYQQHQATIDTLSLLGQLLITAIAVMFLLSILGWATAITYASDWCDRLVDSSLDSANLRASNLSTNPPQPTSVAELRQREAVVPTKTELTDDIATVSTLEPEIPVLTTKKPNTTFRNSKKQATRNQMALQSVLH